MNTKAPSPKQWQLLHRLQAAGCPVDCARIAPPDYPLRVTQLAREGLDNVYSLPGGIGIILPLRIVASSAVTICDFRLRARWLQDSVSWVARCSEHERSYCLQTATHHLNFDPGAVLNRRTWHTGNLRRGSYLQGFLVGTTAGVLPEGESVLEATLLIEDLYGTEYPYSVRLTTN